MFLKKRAYARNHRNRHVIWYTPSSPGKVKLILEDNLILIQKNDLLEQELQFYKEDFLKMGSSISHLI